jgi:hypothetical protein
MSWIFLEWVLRANMAKPSKPLRMSVRPTANHIRTFEGIEIIAAQ